MASNAPAVWPKLDLTGSKMNLSKLEEWKADSVLRAEKELDVKEKEA